MTYDEHVVTSPSGMSAPRPLSQANLDVLPTQVVRPTYPREHLPAAIVHFGVGGFHRAHQAVYLDDVFERRISSAWAEHGVGLLPGDRRMADALLPQDCLYTVLERSAEQDRARVVGSLGGYTFAPDHPQQVLQMLADPVTRLVSLTITEGGYLVDDKTGVFDATNPAIQQDVDRTAPRTVFGYIVAGLEQRRAAGIPPFTVLSCDNLHRQRRYGRQPADEDP
jgi:mannitol 2-dehydrogenase